MEKEGKKLFNFYFYPNLGSGITYTENVDFTHP